jgi:translation initiation factor 2-alpha kinase 4
VYVASFGKIQLQERLDLVRELWAHNIKADFMYEEPTDLKPESLTTRCKSQGINWIVIMKHKTQDLYTAGASRDALITVKIKNLVKKTEEEGNLHRVLFELLILYKFYTYLDFDHY